MLKDVQLYIKNIHTLIFHDGQRYEMGMILLLIEQMYEYTALNL